MNEPRFPDRDPAALLTRVDAEAARDQRERNDPHTAPWVNERDHQAAAGQFSRADEHQRLIDAIRADKERAAAQRAAVREREDRETDAQLRHDRFPFWADRDRPEPGPTDRPGLIVRAHQAQGRTRDRAHVAADRYQTPGRQYPGMTRGRER